MAIARRAGACAVLPAVRVVTQILNSQNVRGMRAASARMGFELNFIRTDLKKTCCSKHHLRSFPRYAAGTMSPYAAWTLLASLCVISSALPGEISLAAGRLQISLSETSGALESLAVMAPSGKRYVLGLRPGSGTVLEGCSDTMPAVIKRDSPGKIQVARSLSCGDGVARMSVAVQESFSATTTSTIPGVRWETNLSSPAAAPFSVPITAALGFASGASNNSTLVWLGGARSSGSPSVTNNPFEPWTIAAPIAGAYASPADSAASFYVAKNYDAAYGCLGAPTCTPASPETQPSATACQAACASHANCTIFAWNEKSQHCWFRLDNMWGAPGTDQPYPAISGCRSGSDPVSGTPYVPGCGPLPGATPRYWYGGQQNNIADPKQNDDQSSVLPMLTRIDGDAGFGLSLVQSPEDTPIVAYSSVAATPEGGGAWLNWTRLYHRLGRGAENISFSADLFVHGPCWRPAARWTRQRYPAFFSPHVSLSRMAQISGTASYGDIRGQRDLSTRDASVYQAGAWALNWDASARFPWHGEWAPTAADGFLGPDGHSSWLTCFRHVKPDGHFAEGCENVSFTDLKDWYQHIRDAGSSSCQCTSAGAAVRRRAPPSGPCSVAKTTRPLIAIPPALLLLLLHPAGCGGRPTRRKPVRVWLERCLDLAAGKARPTQLQLSGQGIIQRDKTTVPHARAPSQQVRPSPPILAERFIECDRHAPLRRHVGIVHHGPSSRHAVPSARP